MDKDLLKKLGNIDQLCGITESTVLRGRGEGTKIISCHNAAGLRFTVVPDRCMDIYDLSYKGINLAFHSKNGLVSPPAFSPAYGEFAEQWPGGLLATCGLDNVNLHCEADGEEFPTHGRIGAVPAQQFGTECAWEGNRYVLRMRGEMHQTCMFRRNMRLERTIETELNANEIRITDRITNLNSSAENYMLLYHMNFGYPLVQSGTRLETFGVCMEPLNEFSREPGVMTDPVDGEAFHAESFLGQTDREEAGGFIYNRERELGCLLRFNTDNLPNMVEWKHLKACDYVLALEPTNTRAMNRVDAGKAGKLAVLEPFECVENRLALELFEGGTEIDAVLRELGCKR